MTVPAYNITTGPYVGNGLLDTYSFDFPISDDTEILVFQKTVAGVESQLTLGVDYSVVVDEVDGTVTRLAGNLPVGVKWLFVSNVDPTQLTAFESQGGFFPDVHEDAFDKLTIIAQQMTKDIGRSMKISEFTDIEGFSTDLTPKAGEGVKINDAGNGLETMPLTYAQQASLNAEINNRIAGDAVLQAQADRSLKFATNAYNPNLPDPVPYQFLRWKANGTGFENSPGTVDFAGAANIENIVLEDGQTTVPFINPVTLASYVINGPNADNGRLLEVVDFTVDSVTNSIELTQSYPAGTILTMVYVNLTTPAVTTGPVAYSDIATLRLGPTYEGAAAVVYGYYTPGDGGGGPLRVWKTDGPYVDNGGSIIVPTGGDGSGAWVWEYSGAVNVKWFGARGNGIDDDTVVIQNAIDNLNNSANNVLHGNADDVYKVNPPTGFRLTSNKTLDGNNCTFTTDTGILCILTSGSYDAHVTNVCIKNIKTIGFHDPIILLFADDSSVESCRCEYPSNIGIQSMGDDVVGNVIRDCHVIGATWHCYATNDSQNYDPAHVDQGLRYPRQVLFDNCIAEDATSMGFDIHSNSVEGLTTVRGGRIINCDLIYKNSFGSCIFDGVHIIKNKGSSGSTWLAQVGANVTPSVHIFQNNIIELDSQELIVLIGGDCVIKNNTFHCTGVNNQSAYFQINKGNLIKITDNRFTGDDATYSIDGRLLNDNLTAGTTVKEVVFSRNTLSRQISLNTSTRNLFSFKATTYKEIQICDNVITTATLSARFCLLSGTTVSRFVLTGNTCTDISHNNVLSASSVDEFIMKNNYNISNTSRYATQVKRLYYRGNFPRNSIVEVPGATSETAGVLVSNFINGSEYVVEISTDRSNSAATFLTKVIYTVLVTRSGLALVTGAHTVAGSEANIGAQFQISGTDITWWSSFTTPVYINVDRLSQR